MAGAGSSARFHTFLGELNISLSRELNLVKKPINIRALAGWRHGEMGLWGPTLEKRIH